MRNEAGRVAHRWLPTVISSLHEQWREAGTVHFIQILHLNEEQSTSVPLGSWQQPMDQLFHQEIFFFPPAGSQREREVVASLSKHAAVRCYAKTPKNFLITSQFKKYWRLTPHPPPPLSPAAVWQIWLWNVAQLTCNILSQAFFNPSQNFSDLICCQSRQTVFRLQTIAAHMDWAVLCQLHFAFHSTGAKNKARIKSDWSTAEESINRDLSTPCSTLFTGCLQNRNVPWI